jgi:two-component sensor histidine kinase
MISLLEMQAAKVADLAALDALLASKGRVQAMTLIHQKLYQQQNIADLEFDAYLRQLVSAVCELYPDGSHVNVIYAVNPCSFGIDTAVPLGLILNELVTNAFKYAFADRDRGTLEGEFCARHAGFLRIDRRRRWARLARRVLICSARNPWGCHWCKAWPGNSKVH